MAASDNVISNLRYINQGDVSRNRPTSEAVFNKLAGTMNALIDGGYHDQGWAFNGYFDNNSFDDGVGGIRRMTRDVAIQEYYMSIRDTGSGGSNIFNVAVYNDLDAFVGNLFGSGANRILISGSNGTNVIAGKTIDSGGDVDFDNNAGGHTIQYGTLNITTLLKGYYLIPFIESNGTSARNLYFNLKLGAI